MDFQPLISEIALRKISMVSDLLVILPFLIRGFHSGNRGLDQ